MGSRVFDRHPGSGPHMAEVTGPAGSGARTHQRRGWSPAQPLSTFTPMTFPPQIPYIRGPVPVEVRQWWSELTDRERGDVSLSDLEALANDPTVGPLLGVPHADKLRLT